MNRQILRKLKDIECDALFLVNDANIRYTSQFTGSDSYVLICKERNYFFTDHRYYEQAEFECQGFEVINVNRESDVLEQKIAEVVNLHQITAIAVEKNHLTMKQYEKINSELSEVQIVPIEGIVENLRYVKSQIEISLITKAAEITDKAFQKILSLLKPGMTELQVALELEIIIRQNGAQGVAFPIIVVSGDKTSFPHGIPSDKKIEQGDLITMDFGAIYNGYRSDMTRTVIMGEPNQKQKLIYGIVKEAQAVGLENVIPGLIGKKVRERVKAVMDKYEYKDFASKGLGHGVGLDIHEKPLMNARCEDILTENCVLTIEPGIYIPNWGGVRIEDTVVVKNGPCQVLTKSTKELISI